MSEETMFDRITRILATPMPRRQALALFLGAIFGTLTSVPSFGQQTVGKPGKKSPNSKRPVLDLPLHNFVMHEVEIYEIFNKLRQEYDAPLSYITSDSNLTFSVNITKGTVQDVLNQMVAQDASYVWKNFNGRVILFPKSSKYEASIRGLSVVKVPRNDAATELVSYLKQNVDGFQDFGVVIVGSISPELMAPITLAKNSTVIECLLQLIAGSSSIVLSVTRSPPNNFYLFLTTITNQPEEKNAYLADGTVAVGGLPSLLSNHSSLATANSTGTICRGLSVNYDQPMSNGPCTGKRCGAMIVANIPNITACPGLCAWRCRCFNGLW